MNTYAFARLSTCFAFFLLGSIPAVAAADRYVAPGGTGTGTAAAPFGRIQDGLNAAQAGDTVIVAPGTYNERLTSVRSGTQQLPIVVRARDGRGSVLVTSSGRVATVSHAHVTLEGLVLDGQFGQDDILRVSSGVSGFTLRNAEVRRSTRDGIDMGAVEDTLIEGSLVHQTLNATGGRADAHGIVAGAARRLTIRNTEVHTFSGDAFQIDPGRSAPGWTDVLIEGCKFWLGPLPSPLNGFAAGVVPGENAVDTKVNSTVSRPRLTIRNTEAFGFRGGLIGNMAAFNIKESVDAVLDRITVHSSEIAFRLRAPASVRVQNAVVHSVAYGVRYEDDIQGLRILNATFGTGVTRPFVAASSSASVLDVQNFVLLADTLPREAQGPSNLAVSGSAFVDAAAHNYQLAAGSPAVDRGVSLAEVTTDRQGTSRPQGTAYDIGAYERVTSVSSPDPDGSAEVVLHAWRAPVMVGNWQVVPDETAAGGARMSSMDLDARVSAKPRSKPTDYFEMTFNAEAGRPYRLWLRGRADGDSPDNDSVYVQFDGAVDAAGTPLFRINTSGGTQVNLEECSGCGLSEWGWQDNGAGEDVLGPVIYFARSGAQRIRVQIREDGVSLDQIVLSPSAYLTTRPGAVTRDGTILVESY
jgi:hypothetical protein